MVKINRFRPRPNLSASLWFSVRILGRSAFALGRGGFFSHWAPEPFLGSPELSHFVNKIPTFEVRAPVRTSEYYKTLSQPHNSHLNTIPPSACSCVRSLFSNSFARYFQYACYTPHRICFDLFITVTVLGEEHTLYEYQIVYHVTSIDPHTHFRFWVPIKFVCLISFAARNIHVNCNSLVHINLPQRLWSSKLKISQSMTGIELKPTSSCVRVSTSARHWAWCSRKCWRGNWTLER